MTASGDWAHEALIEEIRQDVRDTQRMIGRAKLDDRVMAALRKVRRDLFLPADLRQCAHLNDALPIGYGQTISQPYIVAVMTDVIEPKAGDVVLEIGTGSGYQTAILAELVGKVYSVEIIGDLATTARERLAQQGYANVEIRTGNGHFGWPEHAPYDAIVATAAAASLPHRLVDQLKPNGTLVIPIGERLFGQTLMLIRKNERGEIASRTLLPVAFVPLIGCPDE